MIEDSNTSCDYISSASGCECAANQLGMSNDDTCSSLWAWVDNDENGVSDDPPFCYFEEGSLKFNKLGTNTGPCTADDKCLCRKNDFCAEIPCGEGQGDCDDDNECEGSLVCGHMNCMNETISDCCTASCHNDTECLNQECNVNTNTCRLDSYSTAWSNCSHASPCADGEGDCDYHTDCEGALICGNDNCASGTTGMDCCEKSE